MSRAKVLTKAGPFETFEDAFEYVKRFTNYERLGMTRATRGLLDLRRVRAVLDALGCPDAGYPIVHVAGTKGKGSVCAMIASVLQSAGLRVGLFSKPHLVKLNERISLNGQPIPDEHFVAMMNALYPHLEAQRRAGDPLTFFDLITVLALLYFAEMEAQAVVLETGLGGRLDSTNVVSPAVTVITSIDYDHTHILGDTLEQIASEKAGILKSSVPAISGVQADEQPGPAEVIREVAARQSAPLYELGRDFRLTALALDGQRMATHDPFVVETWARCYASLTLPLLGAHQRLNAAVAVAAVEAFQRATSFPVEAEHVRAGLAHVRLRGRIEVLSQNPLIVLDVAHNPSSLRALRGTLEAHFPGRRVVLLLAMSADKDLPGSLREILPLAERTIFTVTGQPRSADPEELLRLACEIHPELPCEAEPNIERAFEQALQIVRDWGEEGLFCVTGSFYLAGEVAKRWEA
jgi:dihydrofolate synthase/folylpolyglutamate synthase